MGKKLAKPPKEKIPASLKNISADWNHIQSLSTDRNGLKTAQMFQKIMFRTSPTEFVERRG
jgi:hypothetical protein